MKRCSKCKIKKPIDNFNVDRSKKDKLHPQCRKCRGVPLKKRYRFKKKEISEYRSNYHQKNREKLNQISKDYYHSNKERHKDRILKRVYGITLEEFNQMIEIQNGLCAGCRRPFYGTGTEGLAPCVDHDHSTGQVRGIIHQTCNRALGLTHDDPEVLENLAKYLRRDSIQ